MPRSRALSLVDPVLYSLSLDDAFGHLACSWAMGTGQLQPQTLTVPISVDVPYCLFVELSSLVSFVDFQSRALSHPEINSLAHSCTTQPRLSGVRIAINLRSSSSVTWLRRPTGSSKTHTKKPAWSSSLRFKPVLTINSLFSL